MRAQHRVRHWHVALLVVLAAGAAACTRTDQVQLAQPSTTSVFVEADTTVPAPPSTITLTDDFDPAAVDWMNVDFDAADAEALVKQFDLGAHALSLPWFENMVDAYAEAVDEGDEALVLWVARSATDNAIATDDAAAIAALIDGSYDWGRLVSAASLDFTDSVNAIRSELEDAYPLAALRSSDPALIGPELRPGDVLATDQLLIMSEYHAALVFSTEQGEPLGHILVPDIVERRQLVQVLIGPRPGSAANRRTRIAPTDSEFPDPLRSAPGVTTAIPSLDGRSITGVSEGNAETPSVAFDILTGALTEYEDRCYVARELADRRFLVCDEGEGSPWSELRIETADGTLSTISGTPAGIELGIYDLPDWGWHDAQPRPDGVFAAQFASGTTCNTTRVDWFPTIHLISGSQTTDLRSDDGQLALGPEGDLVPALLLGVLDDGRTLVRAIDTCTTDHDEGIYSIGLDNTVEFLTVGNGLTMILRPTS